MFDYVRRDYPAGVAPAAQTADHTPGIAAAIHRGDAIRYRPHIDGLRAIAVLAVLVFHAFPEVAPGGFVGVSVFFVVSGYLISSIILKELARGTFSLAEFYRRRVLRIFPALAIVLTGSLALGYFALLPDEFASLGKNALAAAAFVANLAFWREAGYFAPSSAFQPTLHLWSLGIEEQFYLVWPLCLMLAWKRKWNLMRTTAAITLASFALAVVVLRLNSHAAFYFPLARFWELGLGCGLAAMQRGARGDQRRRDTDALWGWLPWVGIVLIATSIAMFDRDTEFPGVAALLPTLGAVCLIAAPEEGWFARKVLAHRALVFVGLISYPLYLWHWPLLSFASILHSGTPAVVVRGIAVATSFVLAVLTFRYVEVPVRTHRRNALVFSLIGVIAAVGIAGFVIFREGGFAERFGADVLAIRPRPRITNSCTDSVSIPRVFNYCLRSSSAAPKAVFLGDSQGQGVYEGVVSVLGDGYPMLLLGRGGCPPGLNVPRTTREVYDSPSDREDCNEAWLEFVRYVQEAQPGMVVLIGDGERYFLSQSAGSRAPLNLDAKAFEVGLASLIEAFPPSTRIVYLKETPTFQTMPTCFLRPLHLPGDSCVPRISRRELEERRAAYAEAVARIGATHPSLVVVDSIPALCDAEDCRQRTGDGDLLYRDRMHLSPDGGERLAVRSGLAEIVRRGIDGP